MKPAFAFLVVASGSAVTAGVVSAADYLALAVGASWTYERDRTYRVTAIEEIDGVEYFAYTVPGIGPLFVRQDVGGNGWVWNASGESLWLDFSAPDDTRYDTVVNDQTVAVRAHVLTGTVTVPYGAFPGARAFRFDPEPLAEDDEYYLYFADGVGLIKRSETWNRYELVERGFPTPVEASSWSRLKGLYTR